MQRPAEGADDSAWHGYGLALQAAQDHAGAVQAFLKVVNLAPHRAFSWLELARSLIKIGNIAMAQPILDQLDEGAPDTWQIIHLKSLAAEQQGSQGAAETFALNAGELYTATNPHGWLLLARMYLEETSYRLALTVLDRAHAADPEAIEPEWLRAFTCALPVYESDREIDAMLAVYTSRATTLYERLKNLPPEALRGLDYLISISHGLFLGYNGRDVRTAQEVGGKLLQLLMQASCPIPPLEPKQDDARKTLAIVSETFYYHSNMKLRRSWLRRIDRTKFRLVLYHVGQQDDHLTAEIRNLCDAFHHIPHDFNGVLNQLQQDRPDIIQYTNIGLNTLTLKLACLRLAPVQATTWGHPITSGLDTIDYYLSSDLMEPAGAEAHYSERLIRLPGLSVVPEPIFDKLPPRAFTRADFGLQDGNTFYLCLQSLQKYLPRHDGIYAAIAAQVPSARFLFINSPYPAVNAIFHRRLATVFAAQGLDAAKHLIFLPNQAQPQYRALHQLADITLDSLGWSGANTTFEALELGGLPLTCPGAFMRGRHTSAILSFIDMPELIAADEAAYVTKAIRLGQDKDYRDALRAKLQQAQPSLYRDPRLGEALNGFYENALRDKLSDAVSGESV